MNFFSTRLILPLSFFMLISYIIFLADTADHNFAFHLVGHIPYGDKLAHAVLYGIMALLLNYGLNFKSIRFFGLSLQIGAVLVLVFATLEEFTQYYIPSRTFDMGDLLADFIGVIIFSFITTQKREI